MTTGRSPNGKFLKGQIPPCGMAGKHHTQKTKDKMRKAHLGRKFSLKHKQNLSKSHKDIPRPYRKKKINKEELKRLYIDERLTVERCAKVFDCSITPIQDRLREFAIPIRNLSEASIGKILSKRSKAKISKALKGRSPWNTGLTKDTDERMRKKGEAQKGKFAGENNPMYGIQGKDAPNWKNGLSREPYPLEWRETLKESIRQRDNYICQKCHIPQRELLRKLDVHHIDYIKDNLDPKNLISLCNKCNCKANYNREYWTKYFKENKCLKN